MALTRDGFEVQQSWPGLRTAQVQADSASLARLRSDPNIRYVEADQTTSIESVPAATTDQGPITWGLQSIHAPAAWKLGSTGQGIKVCVLDSGIDSTHPEFQGGVIKGSKNFVNDGQTDVSDGVGHGTHVAGIIAAHAVQSGVSGAAPGVQLYIARVIGNDGSGTTGELLSGVNWCVNTVHARILNISSGSNRPSRTEQQVFNSVYNKGVLTFAASGNDGTNSISYPAGYSSVIAVGAVDSSLKLADFSDYGSKQELVAPGVHVLSTVPVGTGLRTDVTENGTSYNTEGVEFSANGTVTGPLVDCGLADSTTSCTGQPASGKWIAVITRGGIHFSEKVSNVMDQGASAAVITNNDTKSPDDAGAFSLGTDDTWIPTVSVSYNTGVALRSAGLGTGSVTVSPWNYAYHDGTSMASPYAAAVAALAWAAKPSLTNKQLRTVLDNSAQDLGTSGRDAKYGYGLVEADKAITRARATAVATHK